MIDLSSLNTPQRDAVLHGDGPLLILAGAGSGKTRVLTYRIARLIEQGTPPYRILAITFTNKAAREMRSRLDSLCGAGADAWVMTFHAACVRILRKDIEKLGWTRAFSIYDDDEQMSLIKECLKAIDLSDKEYAPREIKSKISDAKNHLLSPDDWFSQSERNFRAQKIHDVYKLYEDRLKKQNALDFDDLLVRVLELFAENPPVLDHYRGKFMHVLVDEYQDTNSAQYQIVRLLASGHGNLVVVGDDDQSIYGWRGADIRNILDFEKDFPGARVIKLEQNYRSTQVILDAANAVIANNTDRKKKTLWTDIREGKPIRVIQAQDEHQEAALIVQQLRDMHREGRPYGELAVLFRINAHSRVPEEQLVHAGIPYRVVGGQRFYERLEIRDMLAYLRAIQNPLDDASVSRIINVPRRGIGDTTVEALRSYAMNKGVSLLEAIMDADALGLSKRACAAVNSFGLLMSSLLAANEVMPPSGLFAHILSETGYVALLERERSDENQDRIDNIREFEGAIAEYEASFAGIPPEALAEIDESMRVPNLTGFLENVALISDVDALKESQGAVTLMSLHASKGLEFPCVWIIGCEESVFPHSRALFDEHQMEEERRLCYVGITRAMRELTLSSAEHRMVSGRTQSLLQSRFISEIPEELKETRGTLGGERQPRTFAHGSFNGPRRTQPPGPQLPSPQLPRPVTERREWTVGERLAHESFGEGTIVAVKPTVNDELLSVAFEGRGIKMISAKIAPIKHLGGQRT